MIKKMLNRTLLTLACACGALSAWAAPATTQPASTVAATQVVESTPSSGKLRVAVKPAKPFAYEENGQWKGYSVELWTAIAQRNQWQFEWVPMETVPQTIEALQQGRVDVGVGALSITEEREKILDFSQPFFESGLQIMAPAAAAGSIWVAVQGLMSAPVLGGMMVLLATLVVISLLLWLLERRINPEKYPYAPYEGMRESVWWSISVLITGGCEDKGPIGTPGRIVAIIWMLGGIALTSYVTAVFTSTLTVDRLNTAINSTDDLKGQLVGTIEGSSSDAFLSREGIPLEGHETIDSVMQALVHDEVKAVVYDAPLLRYWLSTNSRESDKLALVGEPFAKQHYGFAVPIGSIKRKEINNTLLELRASGFLEELEKRWFGTM